MKKLIIAAALLVICVACEKKPVESTGTTDTTSTTIVTDTVVTDTNTAVIDTAWIPGSTDIEKADSTNKK